MSINNLRDLSVPQIILICRYINEEYTKSIEKGKNVLPKRVESLW